jgi:hypothetical protein
LILTADFSIHAAPVILVHLSRRIGNNEHPFIGRLGEFLRRICADFDGFISREQMSFLISNCFKWSQINCPLTDVDTSCSLFKFISPYRDRIKPVVFNVFPVNLVEKL